MKKVNLLLSIISIVTMTNAFADGVGNSITGYLRDATGNPIVNVTYAQAKKICADKNMRLPTTREFAKEQTQECTPEIKGKQPCGARIIEVNQIKHYEDKEKASFQDLQIDVLLERSHLVDGDGNDAFYFNGAHLVSVEGDLREYSAYSSTVFQAPITILPNNSGYKVVKTAAHGISDGVDHPYISFSAGGIEAYPAYPNMGGGYHRGVRCIAD
jgi:hypothetical protein